jgi:hypothetical protein
MYIDSRSAYDSGTRDYVYDVAYDLVRLRVLLPVPLEAGIETFIFGKTTTKRRAVSLRQLPRRIVRVDNGFWEGVAVLARGKIRLEVPDGGGPDDNTIATTRLELGVRLEPSLFGGCVCVCVCVYVCDV